MLASSSFSSVLSVVAMASPASCSLGTNGSGLSVESVKAQPRRCGVTRCRCKHFCGTCRGATIASHDVCEQCGHAFMYHYVPSPPSTTSNDTNKRMGINKENHHSSVVSSRHHACASASPQPKSISSPAAVVPLNDDDDAVENAIVRSEKYEKVSLMKCAKADQLIAMMKEQQLGGDRGSKTSVALQASALYKEAFQLCVKGLDVLSAARSKSNSSSAQNRQGQDPVLAKMQELMDHCDRFKAALEASNTIAAKGEALTATSRVTASSWRPQPNPREGASSSGVVSRSSTNTASPPLAGSVVCGKCDEVTCGYFCHSCGTQIADLPPSPVE